MTATLPEPLDDTLSTSRPRVLVVEDEETIVEFLTMGLTYEGYDVEAVRDGNLAVATFERTQPQVVLLDLMLPGTDGLTICRALRNRSDVPDRPRRDGRPCRRSR